MYLHPEFKKRMTSRRLNKFLLFCVAAIALGAVEGSDAGRARYNGKALEVPLGADGTVELLQHWTDQAFSGLLAAVATRRKRDIELSEDFHSCSKDATTVNKHAKCVSKLLKNEYPITKKSNSSSQVNPIRRNSIKTGTLRVQPIVSFVTQPELFSKPIPSVPASSAPSSSLVPSPLASSPSIPPTTTLSSRKLRNRFSSIRRIAFATQPSSRFERLRYRSRSPEVETESSTYRRLNIRRLKRDAAPTPFVNHYRVISKQQYELSRGDGGVSPFGMVAKILKKSVLAAKNKTGGTNWKLAVQRIHEAAKNRQKYEQELEKRHRDDEGEDDLEKYAFRGLGKKSLDVMKVLDDPKELKSLARHQKQEKSKEPMRKILDLLREGVKLSYQMTGKNVSDFDDKTLKVASPRFLSVVPENEEDTANLLSPSLFSLHNEGKGIENLTSLPNLVKSFNGADQQQWLDLIIEAAGVDEQADKLEKELQEKKSSIKKSYQERVRGADGQPMFFTKENVTEMYGDHEARKIQTWEKLMGTYTKGQLREMNETGYMILNKDQLHILYGPESPYNSSETLSRLTRMAPEEMHQFIEEDVHRIAEMEHFSIRQKDIILSPIIQSPLVFAYPAMNTLIALSPVVLSPVVGTPAVLGPVVLSPWVFVPVILSPRVLSPLILNPLIFSPIVLSPLVLHPLILSPGVFNPIVLSPLVLSPFILSPQVFTPVILSPMVLNPLILNPMVGSPLVLSPFVLSPLILSPQALFAVVLSPYALSPLVLSPLVAAEVILSPSWLS
ncbi:hypothetical protein FO519_009162 [Halicephalobus sp. NKZ332]|nr:hypothetical protein FO519_009162 [Halicephalobus sp. NKZ332]